MYNVQANELASIVKSSLDEICNEQRKIDKLSHLTSHSDVSELGEIDRSAKLLMLIDLNDNIIRAEAFGIDGNFVQVYGNIIRDYNKLNDQKSATQAACSSDVQLVAAATQLS